MRAMWIDGAANDRADATVDVINPATDEVVDSVPDAGELTSSLTAGQGRPSLEGYTELKSVVGGLS